MTEVFIPAMIMDMLEQVRDPKVNHNHRANIVGRMIDIKRLFDVEIDRFNKDNQFRPKKGK